MCGLVGLFAHDGDAPHRDRWFELVDHLRQPPAVLNQGDGTVSRVNTKTRKVVASIEVGVPGSGGEIAFGFGHVWATVFQIPISEIDPAVNKVVRQWTGNGGDSIRAGHGSVWLSNLRDHNIWRIDPKLF